MWRDISGAAFFLPFACPGAILPLYNAFCRRFFAILACYAGTLAHVSTSARGLPDGQFDYWPRRGTAADDSAGSGLARGLDAYRRDANAHLYAYGKITYEDGFGNEWYTEYRLAFGGSERQHLRLENNIGVAFLRADGQGNEAT